MIIVSCGSWSWYLWQIPTLHIFVVLAKLSKKKQFFIHPNHQEEKNFKVVFNLIADKYDSDTTNGMVMNGV